LRVDERGELVWEKQLEEGDYGSEGWTNCLIDSGDGGVVLGGMREIWRQNPPVLFLTKFDAEGNIIWDRSYDEGHNIPKDIIRTDDGGFIMAGEHGVYLLRVSGDGERIMLQRRQDGMGDFVAGGCDSEYLLGGYSKGGADRWFLMKFKEHLSNP
jgi:hypothetical protein